MEKVTVGLVQLAWSGSIESMAAQYRALIPQAAERGASVVCLPEFSLLPYFPGTRDEAGFAYAEVVGDGPSSTFFAEAAAAFGVTVVGSLFEQDGDRYYDTAVIYNPQGVLTGTTRKVHIPSGDGYHEADFFGGATDYPVHDIGPAKLAAPTCYDQWFPELARVYRLNGADFIFYPTAIGSEPNAPEVDTAEQWLTVQRAHAITNGVFVAAANRVGHENAVTFYGSSFICAPTGEVLAQAGRDTTEVITATLDPAVMDLWRSLFPLTEQRKPDAYARLTDPVTGDLPPRFEASRHVNE